MQAENEYFNMHAQLLWILIMQILKPFEQYVHRTKQKLLPSGI